MSHTKLSVLYNGADSELQIRRGKRDNKDSFCITH